MVHFLTAELTAEELRAVVNKAYSFLTDLQLCGRSDIIEMYRSIVQHWLDTATTATRTAPS